jgi:serine/threonine protein kinase
MNPEASDDSARQQRLNEILVEYFELDEAGQAPDAQAFLAQHATFAAELTEFFRDNELFDRLTGSSQPSGDAALHRSETRDLPQVHPADVPTADSAVPPTAPSAAPRRPFGNYELLEEIGCGGMGVVYRARQRSPNRIVALKMILSGPVASRKEVERFQREAEAAANLQHANIVKIYEVGEHEGQHYFSMEYVQGQSLADMVRWQPLSPQQAARYVEKVAHAIDCAHRQGTLHRDLKPANVLVNEADEPMVTDFGLAKRMEVDVKLTHTREVLGTAS